MYALETSTGYQLTATTVEAVTSALMQQLQNVGDQRAFTWIVKTPHGTALTDAVLPTELEALSSVPAADRAENAYGILVRDHLDHVATRQGGSLVNG